MKYAAPTQSSGQEKNCFFDVLSFGKAMSKTMTSTKNIVIVNPYVTQNVDVLLEGIAKAKMLNNANKIVSIMYGAKFFFIMHHLFLSRISDRIYRGVQTDIRNFGKYYRERLPLCRIHRKTPRRG